MLNSFQHLFRIRFRNPLELLFHLPLIKQYLIVLFGRVQSLILFALQILFAMLRATSSFGLRPHSTQNPLSWIIVSRLQVIHFVLLRKTIVHFFGVTSAFPRFTRLAPLTKQYLIVLFGRVQNPPQ